MKPIIVLSIALIGAAVSGAADPAARTGPVPSPTTTSTPSAIQTTVTAGTAALTIAPNGKFCVDAMIDGKGPYSLLFDSGSEVMTIKPDVAKAIGLTVKNGTTEVKGPTGDYVPVGQVDVSTLQIAGITVAHPFCTVESITLPCDGIIGAPLLNAGIVQVDFPDKLLTTFPSGMLSTPNGQSADQPTTPDRKHVPPTTAIAPSGMLSSPNGQSADQPTTPDREHVLPPTIASTDTAMEIDFSSRRVPVVMGKIGGIDAKLEIDTGSAFPAELYPAFIKANSLTTKFDKLGTVGRTSISGPVYSDVYDMKSWALGASAEIDDQLPTVFIDDSQSTGPSPFDGRVGCPLLAGTTLTFDYPHAKLYCHVGGVPAVPAPAAQPAVPDIDLPDTPQPAAPPAQPSAKPSP